MTARIRIIGLLMLGLLPAVDLQGQHIPDRAGSVRVQETPAARALLLHNSARAVAESLAPLLLDLPRRPSPTSTVYLLPGQATEDILLAALSASLAGQLLPGEYHSLLLLQQEQDLWGWHLPLWVSIGNALLAFIVYLLWVRRRDKLLGSSLLALLALAAVGVAGLMPQGGSISPLVPALQILGVSSVLYLLVNRDRQHRKQLQALHESLETRVQEAVTELQLRYSRLTQDAIEAGALLERRSIYQSIHKDLSDKLLQLIYQAKGAETADLARSALAELRDAWRLSPAQSQSLENLLADMRAEIQTRCDQAGIRLNWQEGNPQARVMSARQSSALSRTLREAVSNLLKHAQASTATLSFECSAETLQYRVCDDGQGMPAEVQAGRGLVNMRQRLEEIGGTLDITSSSSGTGLTFRLPLQREIS